MPFHLPFPLDPRKYMRTPGINPNAVQPTGMQPYELPAAPPTLPSAPPPVVKSPSRPIGNVPAPPMQPMEAPAPPAATRPRVANVPEGLAGLNFGVNPNYEVQPTKQKDYIKANTPFSPVDYSKDPIGRAERDYVINRKLGAPRTFMQKFGDAAKLGALAASKTRPGATWQEQLAAFGAGTAAGGIAGKVSPDAMSSMLFQNFERPNLEDAQGRVDDSLKRTYEQDKRESDLALRQAQTKTEGLQQRNYEGLIEDRQADNARQLAESEARQALVVAQTKAAQTGKPERMTAIDADGKPTVYMVWPDGRKEALGLDPQSQYNQARNQTSLEVAKIGSRTSTANNIRSNDSQERRAAQRGSKSQYVTKREIQEMADDMGLSYEDALTQFMNEGFKVTPED
jgi:hypothetical protein